MCGMHPDIPAPLERLLTTPHTVQRAFAWPRERWAGWLSGIAEASQVLDSLPDSVDRASTAAVVNACVRRGALTEAFIACMVWGHGDTGYGPYRTACILSGSEEPLGEPVDPTVVERLKASIDRMSAAGAVDAYRYLNNEGHIKGLGPAFSTKWLYFISAGNSPYGAQAAPILDDLVSGWLRTHGLVPLRQGKTNDYAKYVGLLDHWGKVHGRTRVQVEEAIFRLIRNDGANENDAEA